jgi:hypothetical protein
MDLTSDIIGTSPKYPKIVNHGAFEVDTKTYDNYPSDNNPIRVVPKLSEMWAHGNKNINLIPNVSVQPLGVRNADEKDASEEVIREAKKAMMSGLKGKEVAEHLRSRFTAKHIQASKDALEKLAGEQGLLGNVYIDASAFTSYKDAEQFLNQHRTRLARDIVISNSNMTPEVVSLLASRFHKNIISSLDYNKDLFDNYKMHLVASGKISNDYVIDSKEALRLAFLTEKESMAKEPSKKEVKIIPQEIVKEQLGKMVEERSVEARIAHDEMIIGKVRPILEFAQAQFSKGKEASDVKEMLRSKFLTPDLKDASEGLTVIASGDLSSENVNKLVNDEKITIIMAEELKRVAKKFPVKAKKVQDYEEVPKTAGIKGFFYALTGKALSPQMDALKTASISALLKGITPERIQAKLLEKVSADDANRIMSEAVSSMNSVSAGVKANAPVKAKKELFPERPEAINFGLFASELPDKKASIQENQELISFYEGANSEIDVSASEIPGKQEVGEMLNRSGMDSIL